MNYQLEFDFRYKLTKINKLYIPSWCKSLTWVEGRSDNLMMKLWHNGRKLCVSHFERFAFSKAPFLFHERFKACSKFEFVSPCSARLSLNGTAGLKEWNVLVTKHVLARPDFIPVSSRGVNRIISGKQHAVPFYILHNKHFAREPVHLRYTCFSFFPSLLFFFFI